MALNPTWTHQQGKYIGKVKTHGLRKSSSGTPSVFFTIDIVAQIGADGGQYAVDPGKEQYIDLWLTEKTIERTVNELRFLGWQDEDIQTVDPGNQNSVSFVDNEYEVECRHEPYLEKGELREKWSFVTPFSQSAVNPLLPEEQRKLNALFGSAFKKKSGGGPASGGAPRAPAQRAPVQQRATQAGVPTGSEIPF